MEISRACGGSLYLRLSRERRQYHLDTGLETCDRSRLRECGTLFGEFVDPGATWSLWREPRGQERTTNGCK